MSVGVDSDYEVIHNKLITEQRAVLSTRLSNENFRRKSRRIRHKS